MFTDSSVVITGMSNLTQAPRLPVSPAPAAGKLLLSLATLTANSDNLITFTDANSNPTQARRIRIQNESAGPIYWDLDVTASDGDASLAAPVANTVSVEWISVQATTLHIFIPVGGTTLLNTVGGVKVSAWA